jgi:hypothetical protein
MAVGTGGIPTGIVEETPSGMAGIPLGSDFSFFESGSDILL